MKASRSMVLLLSLAISSVLFPQAGSAADTDRACQSVTTLDQFVSCQIVYVLDKQQVGQNGTGTERQKESPSIDSRSTSLVDQSSATDFVSVAASLIPVAPELSANSSGSSQSGTGGGTATVSAYALMALFNKSSPTDPIFYKNHINARKLSFTIGTSASTLATDNTSTPSTVYGGKWLIINGRELYREDNLRRIRDVQNKLSAETVAAAQLTPKIAEIMCSALRADCVTEGGLQKQGVALANPGHGYHPGDTLSVDGGTGGTVKVLSVDSSGAITNIVTSTSGKSYVLGNSVSTQGGSGQGATVNIAVVGSIDMQALQSFEATQLTPANLNKTINSLEPSTRQQIEEIVQNAIQPFSELHTTLNNAYDEISKNMQMSIAGTANTRSGNGNNDYRAEFIFDRGLSTRINWTVNGSFDYKDRKTATDARGGRFATSFEGKLTNPTGGWSKAPLTLSFSAEGDWRTSQKPQYSFDAKLSVPITSGFDLPIEYRYANRAAQVSQANSQVRLGLSVDLSRIARALK